MRHVPAHYDGTKVVLDEPVALPVNTPLEVVVPDAPEESSTTQGRNLPRVLAGLDQDLDKLGRCRI